jgi:hypothetical protein
VIDMSDEFHAWRCRECGKYFGGEEINKPGGCCHSALHCPKCDSSQVEELTPGELLGLYRNLEMKLFRERNAALYMAATMKDGIDILVRRMHLSDSVYVGRMQEAVVNYENLNSGEIESEHDVC